MNENIKLGLKVVGVIFTVAVLFYIGHFLKESGRQEVYAEWNAAKAKEAEQYAEDLTAATKKVRAEEQAKALAQVEATKKLMEAKNARQKQVDAILNSNAGNGLSIDVQCQTSDYSIGQPGTGFCRSDGTARLRLSDQAARFLVTEAQRADNYTDQLRAAQQVIVIDRKQLVEPEEP